MVEVNCDHVDLCYKIDWINLCVNQGDVHVEGVQVELAPIARKELEILYLDHRPVQDVDAH